MHRNLPALISIGSGLILLIVVSAAAGFAIGFKRTWPAKQIQEAFQLVESLMIYGEVVASGRRHPAPDGAPREPVALHKPGASIGEGYYALLGWDNARDSYAVFLRDASGELIHTWPIDETTISDKASQNQNAPHAMEVLPDGSVVVSFDWLGMIARLDACGHALWHRDGFFHHSFSPAADGGLWTWYGETSAYGEMQDILKFDPMTGEDMTRLSLPSDVITRSLDSALAFSMFPDFPFIPEDQNPRDLFHPNDVEELRPEMAAAFPQFEAGDLMLSLLKLSLVVVISPSGELKWYQHGPWLRQHDPDFEPDGRIVVYNNSRARPRSSIMAINPQTRDVEVLLPTIDRPFKSEARGKHQRLPNGNRLITIPEQGQALEVAPDGTVVMEFNNVVPDQPRYNDDLVNAKWLPGIFFETMPTCPD